VCPLNTLKGLVPENQNKTFEETDERKRLPTVSVFFFFKNTVSENNFITSIDFGGEIGLWEMYDCFRKQFLSKKYRRGTHMPNF